MLMASKDSEQREQLSVVTVASEMLPLAKTGGLGDVCGALPPALASRGVAKHVFLPAYRSAMRSGLKIEPTHQTFTIDMADKHVACRLLKTHLEDDSFTIYLVDQPQYFDREGLYGDANGEYQDNCERFSFFCRAVMSAIAQLELHPDIVHCHDWQTGLIPALMRAKYENLEWCSNASSVMTIHNLAYQGQFWHHDMNLTGLGWDFFTPEGLEFYGHINLMKAGIVFADMVTTVSPTYAREITTQEFGCGLERVLENRGDELVGIVNGVDYEHWNPESDKYLPVNYGPEDWQAGKAANKAHLQERLGLPVRPDLPLIGIVSRIAAQKGWDLIVPVLHHWLEHRDVQWAILGTGDPEIEKRLASFEQNFPQRLGLQLAFSEELAHQIEAGSDMFLMPSRYEPCGLNQLYSLKYGCTPIVHATGGLADTVRGFGRDRATGFAFHSYQQIELERALNQAIDCFHHQKQDWQNVVKEGMLQDWSWGRSADRYLGIYKSLANHAHQSD